jgi:hypothetical protein
MFSNPGALESTADHLSQELQRETGFNIPAATIAGAGHGILAAANAKINSPTLVKDEWHEAEGLIRDISGISIGEFN